jgi:hypothetical protein
VVLRVAKVKSMNPGVDFGDCRNRFDSGPPPASNGEALKLDRLKPALRQCLALGNPLIWVTNVIHGQEFIPEGKKWMPRKRCSAWTGGLKFEAHGQAEEPMAELPCAEFLPSDPRLSPLPSSLKRRLFTTFASYLFGIWIRSGYTV